MTELRLQGPIDSFNDISGEIRNIDDKLLKLFIDSPGGNVFTGFSIISAIQEIQNKGVRVEVHVESIAASMAAIIAVMADYSTMNSYAQIMVHSAMGVVQTDEDIKVLQNINSSLKEILTKRTGLSEETISNWLQKDTWFNADDALNNGLIDDIVEVKEKAEAIYKIQSVKEIYNNNESKNLVAEFAAIYTDSFKIKTETKIMLDKLQNLLPDITEDNFENKIQELLDVKSDYEAKIKDFEAEIIGLKTDIENKSVLISDLSAQLDEYHKVEEEAKRLKIEQLVDSAIEDGKISAETRDTWLEFANDNYEKTETILNGISVNPKLHEIVAEKPTTEKKLTAHDVYVASLAKKQKKF